MEETGKLVVVSGPSGVGKSTLCKEVMRRTGAQFSVSATTRAPRDGEVDGRDYHFVSRQAFEEMIRAGKLLEWAEVFGNLYGTPGEPVREAISQARTIILDIDVQGGLQVHRAMPQATFVLVLPPSPQELARRLSGRGSEGRAALESRLEKAEWEINLAQRSGIYKHVVVNDDLERATLRLMEIVQGKPSGS